MPDLTTRLVTLEPAGAALDGLLEALRAAARRANGGRLVGRADRNPELPGQPAGEAIFDLTTDSRQEEHHPWFVQEAAKALDPAGVPYTWRTGDGQWHHAGPGRR
jgi:hypothetical protein